MAVTDWYIYREKPLNSEVIFTLYTYTLFYRKKKKRRKKLSGEKCNKVLQKVRIAIEKY